MSESSYAIGIDIGGTEIKAASLTLPKGECLREATAPTRDGDRARGEPAFVQQVRELLSELENAQGSQADVVGLSAPGLVNRPCTAVAFMPGRLAGLEGLKWNEALARKAVPVLNDAHAALMGEIWLGAARDLEDVIMLTLGTGVGGAVVSGGRLLKGHLGRAGHLGHLTVDANGTPDICGTPGSIEDAIGNATIRERSAGRFETTHALVRAYSIGDEEAAKIWLASIKALAGTLTGLINALDPQVILLGGGITAAGEHLYKPLQDFLDQFEWRPAGAKVELRQAQLGIWAGAYGAAYHAYHHSTT